MRRFGPVIAALMVLGSGVTALAHEATSNGVTVAHPWTRATPGGSTVAAAFMEIKADKGVSDRLIAAHAALAGRVEVHTHIMDAGVMKMRRVESIELKDGQSHVLKPMGDHIMLFDLKQPLKEGDLLKLELVFEKAGRIAVEATVEPAGALGPHGMGNQPTEADHHHDHH